MATTVNPREPNDPRRTDGWSRASSAMVWGGALALAIIIGLIAFNDRPTTTVGGVQSSGPSPTTQTQGQGSPQGQTGPLNTTTGGAPAGSPQGDTPPGMQVDPKKPGNGN